MKMGFDLAGLNFWKCPQLPCVLVDLFREHVGRKIRFHGRLYGMHWTTSEYYIQHCSILSVVHWGYIHQIASLFPME